MFAHAKGCERCAHESQQDRDGRQRTVGEDMALRGIHGHAVPQARREGKAPVTT